MPSLEFRRVLDRKSTRLNSSHGSISYAVFCLKKKKKALKDNHVPTPSHATRAKPYPARDGHTMELARRTESLGYTTRDVRVVLFFFFNDPATPEIYPLPLHAPLPISLPLAAATRRAIHRRALERRDGSRVA